MNSRVDLREAASGGEPDLDRLLGDLEALQQITADWEPGARDTTTALIRAVEDLHGEALRRLIRTLKQDAACLPALRAAASDEVVYAVLRRHELLRPSIQERVEDALDAVRPMLEGHGGNVELVSVELPVVTVRLLGACDGCPASMVTLVEGVEKSIREACPEITEIRRAESSAPSMEPGIQTVRIISPFAPADDANWDRACRLTELPEDGVGFFRAGEQAVLVVKDGAELRCFANACAHLGMGLEDGEVGDGVITCPHHGFRYELLEGECLTVPGLCLPRMLARERDGWLEVRPA